ncbi:prolipoprotein diacylglyceryl transferase [Cellulomonas rhizosphaerae]|uniref:Phosphatidylglycerol--prolipoprotein diacylglyceryl transferase n=1 Tax=Cellulomonas rhizosphaerae TaxID=2293719 RepID=A0A413RRS9_9CELL|nr:prolipoprotein diacylglyceryl transferase [Cellulomonas rhizosphaerae]RHA44643.1 prolipoprotein diacylglyceryl transferase [Cellulomonas rhizosphaerae]
MIASIPSPSQGVWELGPIPIRAYALAILVGIVAAVFIARRRWAARGGDPDTILEIAFWAVPFGIVGGRIYHLITSPEKYFGEGGHPWDALKIWEGGLGIWGAIAFGAVGAWIGARRQGVKLAPFADSVAPGLLVAQAIGRLGNWFNQELFGSPTTLPWGLEVSDAKAIEAGYEPGTLFHPTFLYEMVWNLGGAALLVWLDRKFRLGYGRVFWLYVMIYTSGRFWIELLRIDDQASTFHILGLRINVWTSIVAFVGALVAFILVGRRHPGRETTLLLEPPATQDDEDEAADLSR